MLNISAIYLCKRSMQNITRLLLSDRETNILDVYRQTLNKKWLVVLAEASARVILIKKQERKEKKMLERQESGFWNVHRPKVTICINYYKYDVYFCII